MQDSINNNTAIYLEENDSKVLTVTSVSSFAASFVCSEMDVYSLMMKNSTTLKSFGGIFGGTNAAISGVVAIISITDGDPTPSDWWGAAAAALSAAGYGLGYFNAFHPAIPIISLTLGGLSIICSAISLGLNDSSSSNHY